MVPLQLPAPASDLLFVALSLLLPGIVAAVCWAPFLAAARFRSLFERLPPSGSTVPTYVAVAVGASLPFVLGVGGVLVAADVDGPGGVALTDGILGVTLPLSVGYVVAVPVVGAVVLPRLGVDWDPTGYGASTWALLVAGALWYVALFAVPLVAVAVVLGLPGGY